MKKAPIITPPESCLLYTSTTLLYRTLIRLGSATRAEVANETNLSATTIRNLFEELEAGGEIVAGALDRSSGGRRAQRYALNPAPVSYTHLLSCQSYHSGRGGSIWHKGCADLPIDKNEKNVYAV